MEYMTKQELSRVLVIAKRENELHWQAMLTAFYFGLRVSEVTRILGEDVQDGQLRAVRRPAIGGITLCAAGNLSARGASHKEKRGGRSAHQLRFNFH